MHREQGEYPQESVADGHIKLLRLLCKLSSTCNRADRSDLLIFPELLLGAAAFHGAPEDVCKERKASQAIFRFFFSSHQLD